MRGCGDGKGHTMTLVKSGSSSLAVDKRSSLKSVILPVGPPPFLPFLAFEVASLALKVKNKNLLNSI